MRWIFASLLFALPAAADLFTVVDSNGEVTICLLYTSDAADE